MIRSTLEAWPAERQRSIVNEGLVIPAQVNYVGKGANLYELAWIAPALVVTRFLSTA